jgi:predicted dehydrogenase
MEKVLVGIVGAGYAARFHLDSYKRVYGVRVEVVGLTSPSRSRREKLASEYGLKEFESLHAMTETVDLVDICAPGFAHEKVAVQVLEAGCHVEIEKPFTGYYGDGSNDFRGDRSPKKKMLEEAMASADRIVGAARRANKKIMYAENWIYAPSVQKEAEILRATSGQILWMIGDESHSGSHSESYGDWSKSGGGSLVGKACHPLGAMLYLKRQEGLWRNGEPIVPRVVSANVHEITKLPSFRSAGYLRTDYKDVEDYAQLHVTFSDGTVADIFASGLVLGGVNSWLQVFANNHRTKCQLNPIDALHTFNPKEELLRDVYVTEKIGTKQGWNNPTPDDNWLNGYYQEMQDFVECVYFNRDPLSDGELGRECVKCMYAAYVSAESLGQQIELSR